MFLYLMSQNQSSDMHWGNNVLDVRLTAEDKVECAKIMQGYLSGRLRDPILAGRWWNKHIQHRVHTSLS